MCSSQLSVNLHNELSLALEFFSLDLVLSLEIAACLVSLLGLLNLVRARLNYVVLQDDALLKLLGGLGQSLLCRTIMSLVLSTLFVKLKFEGTGDVAFQSKHIKVGVFFHKICHLCKPVFDILIDPQVFWHVARHQVPDVFLVFLQLRTTGIRFELLTAHITIAAIGNEASHIITIESFKINIFQTRTNCLQFSGVFAASVAHDAEADLVAAGLGVVDARRLRCGALACHGRVDVDIQLGNLVIGKSQETVQ